MNSQLVRKRDSDSSLIDRFKRATEAFSLQAALDGIYVQPYRDPRLPEFYALDSERKDYALGMVENLLAINEEIRLQGATLNVTKKLIWAFFKSLQLTGPSDLLDRIDDGDIVDVYSTEHKLIFAGPQFFRLCAYTLEEFYCRPWQSLFGRDRQDVHGMLLEVVTQIMSGQIKKIVDVSFIPQHMAFEAQLENKTQILTKPKLMSPIFKGSRLEGYLCVNGAQIIKPQSV